MKKKKTFNFGGTPWNNSNLKPIFFLIKDKGAFSKIKKKILDSF